MARTKKTQPLEMVAKIQELTEALAKMQEELSAEKKKIPEPLPKTEKKKKRDPLENMVDKDWSKIRRTCPHCGDTGTVEKLFGTRNHRGRVQAQSYCLPCRSGIRYDQRPRKYMLSK